MSHSGRLLRASRALVLAATLWMPFAAGHSLAATYYFSTSGDDRNDGRTEAAPRRSLADIPALMGPGTTILLKRGDVWYAPGLSWDLSGKEGTATSPMRIGAYGDPSLPVPVVTPLARLDRADWHSEGGGVFSGRMPASPYPGRVRFLAGARMLEPAAVASRPGAGAFGVVRDRLYFRPGDDGSVDGLEVDLGWDLPLVRAQGTHHLVIGDLEWRGAPGTRALRLEGRNEGVELGGFVMTSLPSLSTLGAPSGQLPPGTYHLSTSGFDATGDGSATNPWYSVSRIPEWIGPGVTILLRRGDVWYDPTLVWNLSYKNADAQNPMRIGAYEHPSQPGLPRPAVAKMVLDPPVNWQSTGVPNRWTAPQFGGATEDKVFRLYVGGVPLRKVPGPDSLVDDTYCVSSGVIHVQPAGATTQPTVESIQLLANQFVLGWDVRYLTIEDIEFKGGDGFTAFQFSVPSQSVALRNLYVHQVRSYGFLFNFNNTIDAVKKHVGPLIENCVLDKGWTPAMNFEYAHAVGGQANGAHGDQPSGDGMSLSNAIDGATIRGCTVTNFGHSAINLFYNDLTNVMHGVRNVVIEQNTLTAGVSSYCRALSFGGPANVTNIIARRNYCHDQNIWSQLGGVSNYVYSNIWDRTQESSVPYTQYSAGSLGIYPLYATPSKTAMLVRDCVFANNTFVDAGSHFVQMGDVNDGTLASGNAFSNNVAVKWRLMSECAVPCRLLSAAFRADSTYGMSWTLEHNGFWDDDGDDKVFMVERVYPNVDYYTAELLNARSNGEGNQFLDPLFVGGSGENPDKFRLSAASPYRDGGVPLANLLPAGVPAVDYFGNPFHATSPSRGAIQYAWTALASVSIDGAPTGPIAPGTLISVSAALVPANAEVQAYAWEITRDGVSQMTGTASSFAYTPAVAGSYVLTLVATDHLGNARTATPVTVNVWPAPVILPTRLVNGQPVELPEGDHANQDVTVAVTYSSNTTATRDGQPYSWPAGGVFTADGAYVVTAVGTSTSQRGFSIDKTAPAIEGHYKQGQNWFPILNGSQLNKNIRITYAESNVATRTCTLNGGAISWTTNPELFSASGDYVWTITDLAGNQTVYTYHRQ